MKFNEKQMTDPFGWAMGVIRGRGVTSRQLSESLGVPWSTIRALYNGSNGAPRYELLQRMIEVAIHLSKTQVTPPPIEDTDDYDFM